MEQGSDDADLHSSPDATMDTSMDISMDISMDTSIDDRVIGDGPVVSCSDSIHRRNGGCEWNESSALTCFLDAVKSMKVRDRARSTCSESEDSTVYLTEDETMSLDARSVDSSSVMSVIESRGRVFRSRGGNLCWTRDPLPPRARWTKGIGRRRREQLKHWNQSWSRPKPFRWKRYFEVPLREVETGVTFVSRAGNLCWKPRQKRNLPARTKPPRDGATPTNTKQT